MKHIKDHRGYKLFGTEMNGSCDGITYKIAVRNPSKDNNILFTEVVSMSGTAIAMKFGDGKREDALILTSQLALSRAIARIDMGFYEEGCEYSHHINSKNDDAMEKNIQITDEEISAIYLKTLANIRKSNPLSYKLLGTNLEGICSILNIDRKRLVHIAMVLKEDGIVDSGKIRDALVQIGGGHITSKGLKYLAELEEKRRKKMIQKRDDAVMGSKIFIIHGHDNEMKREVQLLLSRAGLEDVVLHECPDKGRTIVDKLIEEAMPASYAIALLSEDDLLADGEKRARQNVILEIGYFLGKLGKGRVRLLKKGNVEIPSDLQGILYTNYDDLDWKIKLLKEILAVGIEFDIQKVIEKL